MQLGTDQKHSFLPRFARVVENVWEVMGSMYSSIEAAVYNVIDSIINKSVG
jgi:hypothetical protein